MRTCTPFGDVIATLVISARNSYCIPQAGFVGHIEIRPVTLGLPSSVRAAPTQSRIHIPRPGSRILRRRSAFPAATVAAAPAHHVWSLLPQGLCTSCSTCPELPSLGCPLLISFSGLCLNITSSEMSSLTPISQRKTSPFSVASVTAPCILHSRDL